MHTQLALQKKPSYVWAERTGYRRGHFRWLWFCFNWMLGVVKQLETVPLAIAALSRGLCVWCRLAVELSLSCPVWVWGGVEHRRGHNFSVFHLSFSHSLAAQLSSWWGTSRRAVGNEYYVLNRLTLCIADTATGISMLSWVFSCQHPTHAPFYHLTPEELEKPPQRQSTVKHF